MRSSRERSARIAEVAATDPLTQSRNAFALILVKLGRRDHTERELDRALLRKGFSEAAIAASIAKAKGEGLVNDQRLALVIARINARSGKRGPRKVIATLRQKGLSAEMAQAAAKSAFADFATADEGEAKLIRFATRLLQRAKGETVHEKRVRVLRCLVTRGFELSEARRIVGIAETTLMTENDSDDDAHADE